jgi:DNA topoisomerase VI subunit A
MKGSHENTFDNQNESDPLIEDLEVALAALREELHVRAENAGSIVGPVVLADDGDRVDCARLGKGGYSVPSIVGPEYIEIRRCTADFVLLVEKGTQWNRLSEDKFWRRYNCVLLTGNGQPPRGVRRLARRLHEEYKIPVYVLVDNDPWGYYIYSVACSKFIASRRDQVRPGGTGATRRSRRSAPTPRSRRSRRRPRASASPISCRRLASLSGRPAVSFRSWSST